MRRIAFEWLCDMWTAVGLLENPNASTEDRTAAAAALRARLTKEPAVLTSSDPVAAQYRSPEEDNVWQELSTDAVKEAEANGYEVRRLYDHTLKSPRGGPVAVLRAQSGSAELLRLTEMQKLPAGAYVLHAVPVMESTLESLGAVDGPGEL